MSASRWVAGPAESWHFGSRQLVMSACEELQACNCVAVLSLFVAAAAGAVVGLLLLVQRTGWLRCHVCRCCSATGPCPAQGGGPACHAWLLSHAADIAFYVAVCSTGPCPAQGGGLTAGAHHRRALCGAGGPGQDDHRLRAQRGGELPCMLWPAVVARSCSDVPAAAGQCKALVLHCQPACEHLRRLTVCPPFVSVCPR